MIGIEIQMMLGLAVGIFLMIFLVLKTKIHTFVALIIASAATGLIGGMMPGEVVSCITGGFGSTLGSIGIVIGLGVMTGRILEVSGAAERMAYTFMKAFGRGKEEWALAATGLVVSIPIFADSGFVILSPLYRTLSKKTGKSAVGLGIALASGLIITHHLVPPTPGPLGAAGIFGADVGQVILLGILFSIPMMIVGILYAKYIGKRIYLLPTEAESEWERGDYNPKAAKEEVTIEDMFHDLDKLPSVFASFAPVVLPIILIFLQTAFSAFKVKGILAEIVAFAGSPVIALAAGLILAICMLMAKETRENVLARMEEGAANAGIILLITGAGGAFGNMIRESGIGDHLGEMISGLPLPAILIPFFIATVIRLIQGSGTVSMITAASISAPILSRLEINPAFATMSACMGAMVFSYFNDSLFWIITRMLGITDVREQLRTWSVPTTLLWATGGILLFIAYAVFG